MYIKAEYVENVVNAIIHPIWLIDEYARMGRNSVRFNPPIAPVNILIILSGIVILGLDSSELNMMVRGVSFCHEDKINAGIQDKEFITPGNQKCSGATPAFIISALIIIVLISVVKCGDR